MSATQPQRLFCFETALGPCALRWSGAGIGAVVMPGSRALSVRPPEACADAPDAVRSAARAIVSLLGGGHTDLRWIELDMSGVEPSRQVVYRAAREIAPGQTASYGDVATAIGRPAGARGVGNALARNPFPIVVPCHRVLSADGALHGFSAPGGISTKRRMLEIERAPGFTQQHLFA